MNHEEENDARGELEVKLIPQSLESLSESDGTFSGVGMVFDTLHPSSSWQLGPEWQDRVRPGAFAKTLAAHEAAGTKPLMLFMHERGNIPGVWTDIEETKTALKLSGLVSKNAVTPSGVPLLELMKMGAITGLSIGFRPVEVWLDERKKVRDILSVELGEVSIVDLPGASRARITDVKAAGLTELLRSFADDLRAACSEESVLSPREELRRLRAAVESETARALEIDRLEAEALLDQHDRTVQALAMARIDREIRERAENKAKYDARVEEYRRLEAERIEAARRAEFATSPEGRMRAALLEQAARDERFYEAYEAAARQRERAYARGEAMRDAQRAASDSRHA